MTSPAGRVVKSYSCHCRNITINAYNIAPNIESNNNSEQAFVGEDGIQIVHSYLTLRTRSLIRISADNLVQHLDLHCLECKTKAYRVVQEIPPGLEAREGPIGPNDGWIEQSVITSRTGWIEVLLGSDGCLAGISAIETHFRHLNISDTFSIAITIPPPSSILSTSFSTSPFQVQEQSLSDDTHQLSTSLNTLNLSDLPPLLPPPPFTPSHPVFQMLSAHATSKSIEWRVQAEEAVHDFLKLKLDDVRRQEENLRVEVDAIWRNYREAWKEVLARSNETRHERSVHSDVSSHGSKKSLFPISIRDFSPSISSGTLVSADPSSNYENAVSLPHTSSSALINRNRPVFGSFNSRTSPAPNEPSPIINHVQLSSPGERGELLTSAFKRNMDTNADIATSLRWAEGEEAMRRRFEAKNEDRRARKRTSKNLGIMKADSDTNVESSTTEQLEALITENSEEQKAFKKQKRRVTFDVRPDETSELATAQANASFLEELFDLDDFPPANSSTIIKDLPINRNPVYKMHHTLNKTENPEAQVSSLPLLMNNASKPFSPLHPETLVNGTRKRPNSISLSDALPLLSSSVPTNDRIISARISSHLSQKTQLPTLSESSPKYSDSEAEGQVSSANYKYEDASQDNERHSIPQNATGELELKNLFAASAPSHRHAWKEGGSGWKMLHRLNSRPLDSPSVEDDGEDPWNEAVSDSEDNLKHPAPLARSLPIPIQPPFRSLFKLEPKTSLADKQGILVPPLKLIKQDIPSVTRTAICADRDLVDPGPTLGLSDHEDVEESPTVSNIDHQDRGRKHALSILQARSTVPEAGMWRSLAA